LSRPLRLPRGMQHHIQLPCNLPETSIQHTSRVIDMNLPRNCGQSEKLLQQSKEDSHGIKEKTF
jgi:hypothetical protein